MWRLSGVSFAPLDKSPRLAPALSLTLPAFFSLLAPPSPPVRAQGVARFKRALPFNCSGSMVLLAEAWVWGKKNATATRPATPQDTQCE